MSPSANSPTERPGHRPPPGPTHRPSAPDYYHALFHRMDQGFCVLELLFDETGQQVVDGIYRQANPVFSQQSGISGDVLGRSALEVMPDLETCWFDLYGRVALTGESERLEHYVPPVGRWFEVHTFRIGGAESREVGVLFHDVTARKQQAQQQAFLLRFSDALRAETSATRVADQALGMLCAQLQLDRCYIGLYDLAGDRGLFPHQVGNHRIPPLPAAVCLSDFPDALRVAHDRTLRIDDLAQTAGLSDTDRQNLGALGLRALVAATLRRGGAGPQWAIVALSADVRHWTPGEVALLEEATERTWAAMEHARAEAALRASAQRQRALIANLPGAAVFIVGRDLRYQLAEGDALRQVGYEPADFLGRTVQEMVTPDQWPTYRAYYEGALAGQAFEHEHEQGGRRFLTRGVPLPGPDGAVPAVLAVSYDLTERKQAEEALRASQAILATVFEALPMGVGVLDTQGRFILANQQMQHYLPTGRMPSRDATQYARWRSYRPDGQLLPRTEYPGARALRGEKVLPGLDMLYTPEDGPDVWTQVSAVPLPDRTGHVTVILDIDAPKRAEAALRHAEERHRVELEQQVAARTQELQESRHLLQTVFHASPTALVVLRILRDAAGQPADFEILLSNEFNQQVVGRDDLVGQRFSALFPQTVPTGILARLLAVATTGEPADLEQWYAGEGMRQWFRHLVVRQDGLLVLTSEVITARKTAEQERARTLHLLEQAEAVAGLGSWDYDRLSQEFRWSEGLYQLFGLPVGQPVRPDVYRQFVVDEDRVLAEELVRHVQTGDGPWEETLRLRVGEQVKTVRIQTVVLPDEAGQPGRVLGVDLDITQLQRLEADNLRLRLSQQRALFEAVQAAQEAERRRIAESLHNGIGQLLYATKLRLDQLHAPGQPPLPALVAACHEADHLLSEAIRQTRVLSHELVPLVLEKYGLEQALQDIGRHMSTSSLRFRCQVLFDEAAAPLSPALQLALYRMAQELAQNIVKHALGATEASLELETMPGWVVLRVEDNGPGFAPAPVERPGLGLRSIHDRVALLEGQLEMGLRLDGGAYVRLRIPLLTDATL